MAGRISRAASRAQSPSLSKFYGAPVTGPGGSMRSVAGRINPLLHARLSSGPSEPRRNSMVPSLIEPKVNAARSFT